MSGVKSVLWLAWRVITLEITIWVSLYRWIARKPSGGGPGSVAFSYAGAAAPGIWVFIFINAIEIPALHLLIPWPTIQFIFLMLGVWSLLWMVGYLAIFKTYPHVAAPDRRRIRYGKTLSISVPWDQVASIGASQKFPEGIRGFRLLDTPAGLRELQVVVSNQANVLLELTQPIKVWLPKGSVTVDRIRLFADEPLQLIAACNAAGHHRRQNRHLAQTGHTTGGFRGKTPDDLLNGRSATMCEQPQVL